jgi:hypothetical protein
MLTTGFGWIEREGHRYEYDIVIRADGTVQRRPKKRSRKLKQEYGHTPLSEEELDFLGSDLPEVVYIGTGQQGSLPVTPEAYDLLRNYETIFLPTPHILSLLEKENRRYVAIIHVTC